MSMKYADRDFKKNPLTRKDTQIRFDDPETVEAEAPFRAQQHHNQGKRLDTANIIAKYFENGIITHTREASARYIDATQVTSFQEAMNIKLRADEAWNGLSPELRKQFDTRQEFVEFCLNEKNADKLREMGLIKRLKMVEPETQPEDKEPPKEAPKAA